MKLVNLTKRPLTLYDTEGRPVELPPDPRHIGLAGLGEHQRIEDEDGHVFSVNVQRVREVKLMPEPEENTLFIVPVEVAMVLQGVREDVVFPAEDTQVRDPDGRLQRVTHLRRIVSRLPTHDEQAKQPVAVENDRT